MNLKMKVKVNIFVVDHKVLCKFVNYIFIL